MGWDAGIRAGPFNHRRCRLARPNAPSACGAGLGRQSCRSVSRATAAARRPAARRPRRHREPRYRPELYYYFFELDQRCSSSGTRAGGVGKRAGGARNWDVGTGTRVARNQAARRVVLATCTTTTGHFEKSTQSKAQRRRRGCFASVHSRSPVELPRPPISLLASREGGGGTALLRRWRRCWISRMRSCSRCWCTCGRSSWRSSRRCASAWPASCARTGSGSCNAGTTGALLRNDARTRHCGSAPN